MSRQITKDTVSNFVKRNPFKKANSEVSVNGTTILLKLHGNVIAQIDELGMLSITNAGWHSNTTKERLNGLPSVRISQRNFQWY